MNAAKLALEASAHLFPHLDYQKKMVEKSLRKDKDYVKKTWEEEVRKQRKLMKLDEINHQCSKRNDERIGKYLKEKKDRSKASKSNISQPSQQISSQAEKSSVTSPLKDSPSLMPLPTPPLQATFSQPSASQEFKKNKLPKKVRDEPKEEGEVSSSSDDQDE